LPAKGKSKVTAAQRLKVAAGIAAGKTGKAIARETGLAHSTVMKQAVDARTRAHAFDIKVRNLAAIEALVTKRIGQLNKELNSRSAIVRHNAGNQVIKFAQMGDPPFAAAPPPIDEGGMTVMQALALYAEIRVTHRKPQK
jgi:hypothetical protein